MSFVLIPIILLLFFLWAISRPTGKKPSSNGTFLSEEELAQRRYNAEQFHARTQKIIADAAANKPPRHTSNRPPASSPKPAPKAAAATKRPALPPAPIRRPAVSQYPFRTPEPTPAPTSDLTDVLVGAAIGYAAHSVIDAMMSNADEGRSCSAPSEPAFESGGGGDFGGGGASGSWND